jgi:hypothetical protein
MAALRNVAAQAGFVIPALSYEDAVEGGYLCGLWWLTPYNYVRYQAKLDGFLEKADLSVQKLANVPGGNREWKQAITSALAEQSQQHVKWFEVGFACFGAAWTFGDQMCAADTATARAIIGHGDGRRIGGMLLGALIDVNQSPDQAEAFFLEKIVPMLYEPSLRKWAGTPDLPALQDLKYIARNAPIVMRDSDRRGHRLAAAVRAFVEEIPIFGKPLAILLFGSKH